MDFHINGDQLVATGGVQSSDPVTLRDLLDRAAAQGIRISTVVFRNSPGGAASGGVGMGEVIRARGLRTVLDGGCYSACADAFAAGMERSIARFHLPAFGFYTQTELGIHGASDDSGPIPFPGQEEYLDYYRRMLGAEGWAIAGPRITQAHYELAEQSGFLYYVDPLMQTGVPTRFCPTGDTGPSGNCVDYPNATIYSDTLANRTGYSAVNDILQVRSDVRGDINPNYARDSVQDAWGVINLHPGATWALDEESAAYVVRARGGTLALLPGGSFRAAERIWADDGGTISMRGGLLNRRTTVDAGGVLEGFGSIATIANVSNGTFAPVDLRLVPYVQGQLEPSQLAIDVLGFTDGPGLTGPVVPLATDTRVGLFEGTVLFSVNQGTASAAVTLIEDQVMTDTSEIREGDEFPEGIALIRTLGLEARRAQLGIFPTARLALDVDPGFYSAARVIPLVSHLVQRTPFALPSIDDCGDGYIYFCRLLADEVIPTNAPFITGRFATAVRWGDDSYSLNLAESGAVFRPRHNSLLSFTVHQNAEAIWLTANPAFDDTSIFANAQSGDGLGVALREASKKNSSNLRPVLGALQFADRDVVQAQAGTLRGDAHASLRMADLELVNSFGNAIGKHLSGVRSRGEDAGGLAALGAYSSGGTLASTNGIQLDQLMMHLAEPAAEGADVPADGLRFWGRGFGQFGRLEQEGEIARMNYNIGGLMLRADKALSDGKVVLGGSLGFGSMSARTRPTQFRGEVEAIDVGAYLDADYGRGFANLSLRYTHLKHDTARSIVGIEGLETPNRAEYDNDALSARLEHGFDLRSAGARSGSPCCRWWITFACPRPISPSRRVGPRR